MKRHKLCPYLILCGVIVDKNERCYHSKPHPSNDACHGGICARLRRMGFRKRFTSCVWIPKRGEIDDELY